MESQAMWWDLIWLIVDRTEAKESELFAPRSFLLRYDLRPKKSIL